MPEKILLEISVLLVLSIFSSKASSKLGVPSLLLFLLLGILAGSQGIGGIYFDDTWLAQLMGVVALVYILFSGGYNTSWSSIRPVFVQGLLLSTFGVLFTCLLVGAFAYYFLHLETMECFLLGAVVSSTDAAAVFSVLRSKKVGLKRNLTPLLEMESASNDPMAVFLTVGLIQMMMSQSLSFPMLILMFIQQMSLGIVLGYGLGKILVIAINHLKLEYKGLYPVLTLSSVLFINCAVTFIGGSGFLAVYITGLVLGNSDFLHKKSLGQFHSGISWLMQISMFLTLGLLVFPINLLNIALSGLALSAFLIFVARPVSVFASLIFNKISFKERIFVSWVGLRGAAPIILATFPLTVGIPGAEYIFNMVFFIVITSILLQGTSIGLVAKWLQLHTPFSPPAKGLDEVYREDKNHEMEMIEMIIPPHSIASGKQLIDLGLPKNVLIILLTRGEEYIVPSGQTTLLSGDKLLMLVHKESVSEVEPILTKTPN